MGWWNAPDNPDLTVGDTVLDMTRRCLIDVSRQFQEKLSRKPTLQELEYTLNLAFKVNVDSDILADVDELEVKQVLLKTARRQKKQKVKPGDIFSYKMNDGRFGFGRIVSLTSVGAFAEIFDHFAAQPVCDVSKLGKWLVPPVPIESYSLLETRSIGDWRIIGHTAGFVPGPEFKDLRYVFGSSRNSLYAIGIDDQDQPISAADARGLPEYVAYDDFRFQLLIAGHAPGSGN